MIEFLFIDKNSKEQFIKKLQLCMKTYDYKDEQKDVKGKVCLFNQRKMEEIFQNFIIFDFDETYDAISRPLLFSSFDLEESLSER